MSKKDPFSQLFPESALDGVIPEGPKPKAPKREDNPSTEQLSSDSSIPEGIALPPHATSNQEPLTVSQLLSMLNTVMDMEFGLVTVVGEISGIRKPASGHLYFSLKEENALISAVLFKGRRTQEIDELLTDGTSVLCTGTLNVYKNRGQLQLIVNNMAAWGIGRLRAAFEALKEKLHQEGLFEPENRAPIPSFPNRVFLITSPTGAAVRDFLKVAEERFCQEDIILCPSRVQGEQAPQELIRAIDAAEKEAVPGDVIVLLRGGGSLEDLWAFNDENLARRIHRCTIPVVSAVGHEIDFTISDFVADLRAPTPTAAAQMVLPACQDLQDAIDSLTQRAFAAISSILQVYGHRLSLASARLRHPRHGIIEARLRLDELSNRLDASILRLISSKASMLQAVRHHLDLNAPGHQLLQQKAELVSLSNRLKISVKEVVQTRAEDLAALCSRLNSASPLTCLERGFCLVRDANGRPVTSSDQVNIQEILTIRPKRGRIRCRVVEKE